MNLQGFLDNFRYVVEAPNGVKQLRELIYFLGVTGGLCPQDSADGDGVSLLEEIQQERKARIERGLFKRSPRLEAYSGTYDENRPKIPPSWAWTRLVDIGEISPKNVYQDETLGSFASMSAISETHGIPIQGEDRPWQDMKKGYTHISDGDVVVAKITPCFENGKAAAVKGLTNGFGAGTTEIHVVRPLPGVLSEFIYLFLRSPYFKANGIRHMTGTAGQKRLPSEYLATLPFPLPPRAEQNRIVAKVDELMAVCDKLEAQQQERRRRFPWVSAALHAQFVGSPTSAMVRDLLSGTVHASPDDLRKSILKLAVQGKLTARFKDNAKRSWEEAEVETEFAEQLSGFKFPNGWHIELLEHLAETVVDCPHSTPKWTSSGKICLRTNQFRPGCLDLSDSRFVSEETFRERTRRLVPQGDDVLYSREGGILGVACRVPFDTGVCLGQRMMLIRTGPDISASFLEMVLNSPLITGIAKSRTTGGAAPRVNMKTVRAYPIPVPPLAEQDEIVCTVDQLMKLIAKLEDQVRRKSHAAEAFARAAVSAITGTATQESKPMKAPETELLTSLEIDQTRNRQPGDDEPLSRLLVEHDGALTAKALWQRSGLAIDAFYQQLKTEMAAGWILEPEPARMSEVTSD